MWWAMFFRSWRIKVLLLCLLLMSLLLCVKWFYLDPSSDREQCVGAQCDERLAALQSNLEHPVLLPPQLAPPHNPAKLPWGRSPQRQPGVPSEQSPRMQEPRVQVQEQLAQDSKVPLPRIQPAKGPSPQIQPAQPPQLPETPPSLVRPPRDSIPQKGYHQAPPLPTHFHNLTLAELEDVEKFVFFIGYGRSGHSIVASIMDAHPNVIIAHEYYLFDKFTDPKSYQLIQTKSSLFDELYWSSYHSTQAGWRSDRKTGKGYNLNLSGSWQGQFKRLKVIGDKTGGSTAMLYHNSPLLFKAVLRRLRKIAGVPYAAVHVVRNPYDMIATTALYQASSDISHRKVQANTTAKFKQLQYLEMATNLVLAKAAGVQDMVQGCHLQVLEIHLEDLITNSSRIIHEMCRFLGVPCADAYVQTCQKKVFGHTSRSRDVVVWTDKIREQVERAIQRFPFFNRYSFEDVT